MDELETLIPEDVETTLVFFVNGKKVVEPNADPEWTLLWYLRRKLQLTGTKYGCGEGGCGACTVMVSQYVRGENRIKHMAVNACLTPVCAMHGLAVITIEGIGTTQDKLHPVQERIAMSHGSQCGFCTPGIVMSMYTLLRNRNKIQYIDIETALQGNLCRCTGYRPILEGFKTFIEGWERKYVSEDVPCMMGKECCRNKGKDKQEESLCDTSSFKPYDPSQEPIFPPELKLNSGYDQSYLFIRGPNIVWIRPVNIQDLLKIKHKFPSSKIVVGNTEIGVEMKFKRMVYPILLSPSLISDLNFFEISEQGITVGAATPLTDIHNFLEQEIDKNPVRGKVFLAIKNMLHWFAGSQVRNVASLAGNIITASPISDLNPILMASGAVLNVYSLDKGLRKVTIDEYFFKSYRKTSLNDNEIVVSIEIPATKERQYFKAYKQARRRDDDISIVTAAFNITLDENSIVSEAKMCFGGMGPTTLYAQKSSKLLVGHEMDDRVIGIICESLLEELNLDASAPGGMVEYRKSLCLSLFFRFCLYMSQNIVKPNGHKIPESRGLSGVDEIPILEPISSQCFEIKDNIANKYDVVGRPVAHLSAFKQATGEAMYCDDIPSIDGELYLSLVLSSESHAKIISIDVDDALSQPGVVAFFSAKDLDENCNKVGPVLKDEEIFSKDIVTSQACVIGAIVAKTELAAKKAKDLVIVTYERLDPVIVTIEDAIKHQSYFSGYPQQLRKGDVENAFKNSSHIVEGKVRIGAQEHFYLETMSAYAHRKEDELEVIMTTQAPAEVAHDIAQCLQIPNHKVIAKVKRIGGGFGGKETKGGILGIPVAIAAYKLKKPIRAVLDRDEDMQITGYRHPFLIQYKIAFDNDGRITGAVYDLYANTGYSMDISCSLMDRSMYHVDNCYFIPNIEVNGYLCKTNMPSNTAFRGFGAPQAMLAAEIMIRHVASALNKSFEEIVEINMYREGYKTHLNQQLSYCTLSKCWEQCIVTSDYWQRKKIIDDFNSANRWKKKGIALVPTKYGISFQTDFLMQAGALVLIYTDGSVLVSIGGIEMGQGLYIKMIQVASKALEIEHTKIYISETATDKIPNSSPTAASMSSDLYGMAVLNACTTLKERIAPYKEKNPSGTWGDWISEAYMDRVSLFATGFYRAPKIQYDRETNSGDLFEYFTYGVACSEVIVDCLTGDHQVLRSDIVMDLGESLNPAIDIGQIEGAFMQGYGLFTLEEMMFSPRGDIISRGPGAYKIPAFSDIPKVFNVSLLKGAPNPRAVYSSKAVGEPPLFLAASIYFAIKEAIKSARGDSGVNAEFELDTPATCARIRMACEDSITNQVKQTTECNRLPWNVVA